MSDVRPPASNGLLKRRWASLSMSVGQAFTFRSSGSSIDSSSRPTENKSRQACLSYSCTRDNPGLVSNLLLGASSILSIFVVRNYTAGRRSLDVCARQTCGSGRSRGAQRPPEVRPPQAEASRREDAWETVDPVAVAAAAAPASDPPFGLRPFLSCIRACCAHASSGHEMMR